MSSLLVAIQVAIHSISKAYRLKSSITLTNRMLRQSSNWSCVKLINHT